MSMLKINYIKGAALLEESFLKKKKKKNLPATLYEDEGEDIP